MLSAGWNIFGKSVKQRNHEMLECVYKSLESRVAEYQKTHSIALEPGKKVVVPADYFKGISVYTSEDGASHSYGVVYDTYYGTRWTQDFGVVLGRLGLGEDQITFDSSNKQYSLQQFNDVGKLLWQRNETYETRYDDINDDQTFAPVFHGSWGWDLGGDVCRNLFKED